MYYKLTGFTQKLMVSAPVASLTMIFLLQWCKKPQDANWVPDFQKVYNIILYCTTMALFSHILVSGRAATISRLVTITTSMSLLPFLQHICTSDLLLSVCICVHMVKKLSVERCAFLIISCNQGYVRNALWSLVGR
uniref:Uncharacterized protein n=1 Tax=Oreochromis aureus TaxID=47969 RepID=A0A668SPW7_OREAU